MLGLSWLAYPIEEPIVDATENVGFLERVRAEK